MLQICALTVVRYAIQDGLLSDLNRFEIVTTLSKVLSFERNLSPTIEIGLENHRGSIFLQPVAFT